MASKKKPLPKRIYVNWERNINDRGFWLNASETIENEVEDGEQVGVYELNGTRTKRVVHDLK